MRFYSGSFFIARTAQTGFMEILDLKVLSERHGYARMSVLKQLVQGALPADSRLPSVRQLAIELSINPNTIQRAYMTLEQEGLIYPVKGKGNFVADTQKIQEKYKEDFRSEFLELVKRGCRSGFEEKELLTLVQRGYKEE